MISVCLYTTPNHYPIHCSPRASPAPGARARDRPRAPATARHAARDSASACARARVPAPPHSHLHPSSPPLAFALPAAAPTPAPAPHPRTPFSFSWRTSPRSHQLEHACPANARLRSMDGHDPIACAHRRVLQETAGCAFDAAHSPLDDVAVGVALAHGLRHNDCIDRHVSHDNTGAHDFPEHALIVIERVERDIDLIVASR